MAINYCLQQIKAEGIVNVRGFVSKMREQRNHMVQTEVSFTQLVWQPSQTRPLSPLQSLTLSLLPPPFSHLSPHISNNTHSSTMPSWKLLHMETPLSHWVTFPQAMSSWKRSIKKQGDPCWRRSLTDWPQSEQWCWRALLCRGSNWKEIAEGSVVSVLWVYYNKFLSEHFSCTCQ